MVPIISVVIPAYNAEKTVKFAIDSLLNQTISDLEIIVVDDGSSDDTFKIVEQFIDTRIILFKRDHLGPGSQRNFGIQNSHGKYVAFLDADDIAISTRLEKQLEYLTTHPNIKIVGSQAVFIDSNQKELFNYNRPIEKLEYFLPVICPLITSSILFKKEIVEVIGFFNENLEPLTDYEWYLKAHKYKIGLANIKDRLIKVLISKKSFTKVNANFVNKKMYLLTQREMEEIYKTKKKDFDYFFRIGIVNFYYFKCSVAISAFIRAIFYKPSSIISNSYFIISCFLGKKIQTFIKSTGIPILLKKVVYKVIKSIN